MIRGKFVETSQGLVRDWTDGDAKSKPKPKVSSRAKFTEVVPGWVTREYTDDIGERRTEEWKIRGEGVSGYVFVDGRQPTWPCGSTLTAGPKGLPDLVRFWHKFSQREITHLSRCPHCGNRRGS